MVKIIEEKCIGCGICARICPEGFEIVNGKSRVKDENANCLQEAANSCPRQAIILGEEGNEQTASSQSFNQRIRTGIERGQGFGRGTGRGFGAGFGSGRGRMGRFALGPGGICRCPNCGYEEPHERGVPCASKTCPKCGTRMIKG